MDVKWGRSTLAAPEHSIAKDVQTCQFTSEYHVRFQVYQATCDFPGTTMLKRFQNPHSLALFEFWNVRCGVARTDLYKATKVASITLTQSS